MAVRPLDDSRSACCCLCKMRQLNELRNHWRSNRTAMGFIFRRLEELTNAVSQDIRHNYTKQPSIFFLFLFQLWYYFKRTKGKIYAGRTTGIFFFVVFTARFIIEFVKKEQVEFQIGMTLNMGQWLSIPFILIGIACLIYSQKKKYIYNPAENKERNKTTDFLFQ